MKKIDPKSHEMVLLSFDYIRRNRNKTTEDLPDELLKFWAIPDFSNEKWGKVEDAKMLVFMFVLKLQYKSLKEVEMILNSFRFYQSFYHFQVILAATAYSRKSHIPIKPCKIFDVREYAVPTFEKPGELIREYNRITKQGE